MSQTEQILDRFVESQGWTDATVLDLALTYIENQASPEAWEDYLLSLKEVDDDMGDRPPGYEDCGCDPAVGHTQPCLLAPAVWPEHDTAPCVERGEHLSSQRHPETDCPTYDAGLASERETRKGRGQIGWEG